MANQSPDRRAVLEMLAKVAAVSQFPGFSRWSFSDENEHSKAAGYRPQFFSAAEYELLEQLSELIIPRDETPGARDAGVAEFIDHIVAHDPAIQFQFRSGLGLVAAQDFMTLPLEKQEDTLRGIQLSSPAFFKLLRSYTVMGYYTTRIGLEALDYPGLRFYSASPECPHKDDPEHKHLPPPRSPNVQ